MCPSSTPSVSGQDTAGRKGKGQNPEEASRANKQTPRNKAGAVNEDHVTNAAIITQHKRPQLMSFSKKHKKP